MARRSLGIGVGLLSVVGLIPGVRERRRPRADVPQDVVRIVQTHCQDAATGGLKVARFPLLTAMSG